LQFMFERFMSMYESVLLIWEGKTTAAVDFMMHPALSSHRRKTQ
jgi:hypothetical protein